MSDDSYYETKKLQFKNIFGKEWNSNTSDFLQYLNIETNQEFIESVNELKSAIIELKDSNYGTNL